MSKQSSKQSKGNKVEKTATRSYDMASITTEGRYRIFHSYLMNLANLYAGVSKLDSEDIFNQLYMYFYDACNAKSVLDATSLEQAELEISLIICPLIEEWITKEMNERSYIGTNGLEGFGYSGIYKPEKCVMDNELMWRVLDILHDNMTERDFQIIREFLVGKTIREISDLYNLSYDRVKYIINGMTHRCVKNTCPTVAVQKRLHRDFMDCINA